MSSASQSHLTSVGYDMIVATTQKALNATMLLYMSETNEIKPTVKYYVWRKVDDPKTHKKVLKLVEVQRDELDKATTGVDPWAISADADPESDVNLQRLRFAQFALAFSITPGLPQGLAPSAMPNIIQLGNESSSVKFNMLCSEVKVCSMVYAGMDVSWFTFTQPIDQPWAFSCNVDMRMSSDNTASAFAKLPADVQRAIKASFQGEDAFSVQQLLMDLDNAGLQTVPALEIMGGQQVLDPQVVGLINGTFLSTYFADMHARGQPTLHVAVVSNKKEESEFRATDMTMEACQLLDLTTHKPVANPTTAQSDLSTFNYLCMSNNKTLPPAQLLTWNWMNEAESHQYDGVIAFNRNTFADMLRGQLEPIVLQSCFIASAKCWLSAALPQYACGFKRLSGGDLINPQNRDDIRDFLNTQSGKPTYSVSQAPDNRVMKWSWKAPESHDSSGHPVTLGSMTLQPSYTCEVEFVKNQVIITQHLVIWMDVMKSQVSGSGNIVDRTMVETFTLKVDNGRLVTPAPKIDITDHSETPGTNSFFNFFNKFNDEVRMIQDAAKVASSSFQAANVNAIQRFQFPGGKTFAFRDFQFSNFQDLTAAITYVDPV